MATIRDVAKLAGVSASTASRILTNSTKEKYAEETRLRVLNASISLGYRPNFAARALVSGQTRIVAAIFPRNYGTPFTATASLQILAGIEAFCSQHGYHMLITSPRIIDGEMDANFTNLVAGGYLDGLIILGYFNISAILDYIVKVDVPTIVLGHHPYTHFLRGDDVAGGRMMMRHLLELGHRQIGLISVPDISQRYEGVKQAAAAYGIDAAAFPMAVGDFSEQSGLIAAQTLIREHPELTALVAFNDRMAMGAIKGLQELGYGVPDQISVVGYDDLPRSSDFNPPLTTINHRLSEWGGMAMEMLLELMNGGTPEPITLTPELIVRQSTAQPRPV